MSVFLSNKPKPWTAASINLLTQDEIRCLFDAIDSKRDSAIFLLADRHGLRASEVGMLQTADLDLQQYRLHIHRLKNSLAGRNILQPDEVKALKAYQAGGPQARKMVRE
jgi:integrase